MGMYITEAARKAHELGTGFTYEKGHQFHGIMFYPTNDRDGVIVGNEAWDRRGGRWAPSLIDLTSPIWMLLQDNTQYPQVRHETFLSSSSDS